MPHCVVDACVAVKWFIKETHHHEADAILTDFGDKKLQLIAPDIIVSEVGSVLWKLSTLRSSISTTEASSSYHDFLALGIQLHPCSEIASSAMRIALAERCTVYDAMYMALAEQKGCDLITADEKLYSALGKKFCWLRWIGDYLRP
jgi:predicted nucleic acid-binding protein